MSGKIDKLLVSLESDAASGVVVALHIGRVLVRTEGHVFFHGVSGLTELPADLDVAKFEQLSLALSVSSISDRYLFAHEESLRALLKLLRPMHFAFLSRCNGIRSLQGGFSLAGLPLIGREADLYVPTCLFATNIIERRLGQRDSEVFIGRDPENSLNLFLDSEDFSIGLKSEGGVMVDQVDARHFYDRIEIVLGVVMARTGA